MSKTNLKSVVILYENSGFRGKRVPLHLGYYSGKAVKRIIGNDKISSLTVPRGFKVTLFENGDFNGARVFITHNVSNLKDVGFNDETSSIAIELAEEKDPKLAATFFDGEHFKGRSTRLPMGTFNQRDLKRLIGDNKISSIRLDKGLQVTLYDGGQFNGKKTIVLHDLPKLRVVGMDNKTSSITIGKADNRVGAPRATFYDKYMYKGKSITLGVGYYDKMRVRQVIGDNKISSLKIPKGLRVCLFEDEHFSGRCRIFTHDIPNLKYKQFDNMASAIAIERWEPEKAQQAVVMNY